MAASYKYSGYDTAKRGFIGWLMSTMQQRMEQQMRRRMHDSPSQTGILSRTREPVR